MTQPAQGSRARVGVRALAVRARLYYSDFQVGGPPGGWRAGHTLLSGATARVCVCLDRGLPRPRGAVCRAARAEVLTTACILIGSDDSLLISKMRAPRHRQIGGQIESVRASPIQTAVLHALSETAGVLQSQSTKCFKVQWPAFCQASATYRNVPNRLPPAAFPIRRPPPPPRAPTRPLRHTRGRAHNRRRAAAHPARGAKTRPPTCCNGWLLVAAGCHWLWLSRQQCQGWCS